MPTVLPLLSASQSDLLLYASAARTATPTVHAQKIGQNHVSRGVLIHVRVTALAATPSIVPTFEVSLDQGTTWVAYKSFTAITDVTISTPPHDFLYLIYPGILATAIASVTEAVNLPLPRLWRLRMVHGDTDSCTYSVRAQLL